MSHSPLNHSIEENLSRSATPPKTRAGVMIAKVSWNIAKTLSGTVPLRAPRSTPAKNALSKPPVNQPPSPKARL